MKKLIYIMLLISLFALTACSKGNKSNDDNETKTIVVDNTKVEYETVTLTLATYKKYIAIYEDAFDTDKTREKRTYFNIYGASGCRFENCVITYEGTSSGTIELSMSGNGQIIFYSTLSGQLNITAISGTVKYPKI